MESLGDLLKEAREEKGITIEQAERETKILKCYLNAIEMEDFSNFPGETYIIGFIRNYAEFLGCDADACVQMYRNLVIQGQPVPLEELVTTKKKIDKKKLIMGLGIATGIIVVVGFSILISSLVIKKKESNALMLQSRKATVYEFNSSRQLFELQLKDSISLTEAVSREDYIITYDGQDRDSGLAWFLISGNKSAKEEPVEVKVQDYVLIDLNKDEINDLKLSFLDLDRGGKASLELDRAFIDTPRLMLKDDLFTEDFYKKNKMEVADGVVMKATELKPFTIKMESTAKNTLFYRADGGKTTEVEIKNEEKALFLELRAGGIFWIANANDLKVKVDDVEIPIPELKDPSVAFVLCWKQLPADGGYELGYYLLDK